MRMHRARVALRQTLVLAAAILLAPAAAPGEVRWRAASSSAGEVQRLAAARSQSIDPARDPDSGAELVGKPAPRWTLDRYWLDGNPERNWTSVSFLIDRDGVIRWVHGGGEYHPSDDPAHLRCDAEYRGLEQALAQALAEKPGPAALQ